MSTPRTAEQKAKRKDWRREYDRKHKVRRAAADKARYDSNPAVRQRKSVAKKVWNAANPEKRREGKGRGGDRRAQNHRRKAVLLAIPGTPITRHEFKALCDHYDNRCAYCDIGGVPLQLDHIVPVTHGGTDEPMNWAPACGPCNSSKGAKPLMVWLANRVWPVQVNDVAIVELAA